MPVQIKVDVKFANYRDLIKLGAEQMAHTLRVRSQLDVAQVGRRFIRGITVPVKRISKGYSVQVVQKPAYAKVFEFGGTSRGKPLLWIPLERGRTRRAKSFRGKLYRPKGVNILVGARDRKVKFIGVSSITNRRRTHLRAIAQDEANKFVAHMGPAIRKGA
jgi:hypothetical protein